MIQYPKRKRRQVDTHVRFSPEDRELVERAAELDERSLSQFVSIAATKAARERVAQADAEYHAEIALERSLEPR